MFFNVRNVYRDSKKEKKEDNLVMTLLGKN